MTINSYAQKTPEMTVQSSDKEDETPDLEYRHILSQMHPDRPRPSAVPKH